MRRFALAFNKDSLRNVRECVIDEAITVVLLSVSAVIVGILLMMGLNSCTENSGGKKKETLAVAEECIRLLAESPESVRILAFSEPDSVFGGIFFSDEELRSILDNVTALNDRLFSGSVKDIDFDDPKVCARLQRGASVSGVIQDQMLNPRDSGTFSGWKVKAIYECLDQFGDTVRNERYFIFDKDMNHIIHSFEIPIL